MEPIQIILGAGLVASWVVFYIFYDRDRIKTLLSVGILISLLSVIADVIGSHMALWVYPVEMIPLYYLFYPVDLALLPVEAMLLAQYAPKKLIHRFALFLLMAIINAGAEYFVEGYSDALFYYKWSPIYSLPLYIILFSIADFYYRWLNSKSYIY